MPRWMRSSLRLGYARDGLPEAFRDRPIIGKPFTREHVLEMLDRLTPQHP